MIKQLQSQLSKLKGDSQKREGEFTRKKQEYQQIISDLQAENQKLRKFIDEQPLSSNPSFANSPVREIQSQVGSPSNHREGHVPDHRNMEQVMRENEELRSQLQELTRTYQEQIQQMTLYFNQIRNAYFSKVKELQVNVPPRVTQPQTIQSNFSKIYDKMIRQFQQQRKKYIDKIEELIVHIGSFEKKEDEYQKTINNLKFQYDIIKEQLTIYKRIR